MFFIWHVCVEPVMSQIRQFRPAVLGNLLLGCVGPDTLSCDPFENRDGWREVVFGFREACGRWSSALLVNLALPDTPSTVRL